MAALLYHESSSSQLANLELQAGSVIYLIDTNKSYYDISNTTRIKISNIVYFQTEDDRIAETSPSSKNIYIVLENYSFYRYDNFTKWSLVSDSSEIEDLLAIFKSLTPSTLYKGSNLTKNYLAPVTLAKSTFMTDGSTVEDVLKTMTHLGTSIDYVVATEAGQKTFRIPYPFNNYDIGGNTFMVFIGTTFIDNRRYSISKDGKFLILNDISVKNGRSVSFVFLFNVKAPALSSSSVTPYIDGKYITKRTIPISRLEKYSTSITENDINSVATSAAVARLYESLLSKLDALGSNQAVYLIAGGDGTNITAYNSNFTLTDFTIIHLRLNSSGIKNNATLSINGGKRIPIYATWYEPISDVNLKDQQVISLFYNESENRFYAFTGLPMKVLTTELVYTTVLDNEYTFNFEALDLDPLREHLSVYQDGIRLVEDYHYQNNNNNTISLIGYRAEKDTEFTFVSSRLSNVSSSIPEDAVYQEPTPNPGGEGEIYNPDIGTDDIPAKNFIDIGSWTILTDDISNNLQFLYNDVLKFVITPTSEAITKTYTEHDL